jgi:hypothetical protein
VHGDTVFESEIAQRVFPAKGTKLQKKLADDDRRQKVKQQTRTNVNIDPCHADKKRAALRQPFE